MSQIDFKKVFSKLSHIKALSHDQKFDQIVQNLIMHALNQCANEKPRNEDEVGRKINEIYGISIRTHLIMSNLDKLLDRGELQKDPKSKQFIVNQLASNKLNQRIEDANNLEQIVKDQWLEELRLILSENADNILETIWKCLNRYLCSVFEHHGIQTLHFLNPSAKINEDDQRGLDGIVESIYKECTKPFDIDVLRFCINNFIKNADETRTNYISSLADSSFTSFALTSDAETVNFLNQRYNNLQLFLDTNFIFGILDLHKNSEDASAREILEEVKKNRLPFKLAYHPETLNEFKRAFDVRAMYIRASRWTRESSRVAIAVDGLSPLEDLFHRQNIENEIDTAVFLDKYDHVDLILKDLGLTEFIPQYATSDEEFVEIESDIEKYQHFYESIPNRKVKSFLGFKHDIVVLREVRSLNPKKTKFLDSNAFFISSDYTLAKFEKKHYKKSWEINYVVSPSVFLQLIRPFIENDYSSNKRFIDTFSIPEIRSFEIDYSTTRSKTLQILNDNYHDTSFETKVKILRDQVILEKLNQATNDFEKQLEIIENQIAIENQILTQQNQEAVANIGYIKQEKEKIEHEKNLAITENETTKHILKSKVQEIDNLKTTHEEFIEQQALEHKSNLLKVLEASVLEKQKQKMLIDSIIDQKINLHKYLLLIPPTVFCIGICLLIYYFTWTVMEPFTYVLSIVAFLASYLFLVINGESWDPKKYFFLYKRSVLLKIHGFYGFDQDEHDRNKELVNSLNIEISILKSKIRK